MIRLGVAALQEEEQSISFAKAVDMTLQLKSHRSKRTIQDIRQTMNTLMSCEQGLSEQSIRSITCAEWSRILNKAYAHSPSRFMKARANLSGVYTLAYKHGWCKDNPVKCVPTKTLYERTITPLSIHEIKSLLTTARLKVHRDCFPALSLMLYTGVRPDEIKRLSWRDIDWEEGMLCLAPRHTKTGGGRHIPIIKPLLQLLKHCQDEGAICPKGWKSRWQYLREAAGFTTWVPDVLRHSYASYHAKMYKNLPLLQLSMGHRDSRLLLTRYINMRGISKKDAQRF
ncbi:MAG: tyrosine-type recombinase/integrase [Akkermansia sp.]